MKKILAIAVLAAVSAMGFAPVAFAATAGSGAITTSASVDGTLSLSVTIRKNDFSGAIITSMDFGRLVDIGTGTLRSSPTSTTQTGAAVAFVSANSHGIPYTISQVGTVMSNGSTTLPNGALAVTPTYSSADNVVNGVPLAMPASALLGTRGTWVGSRTLYTSEPAAAVRVLQFAYSVTDDPAAGATTGVPANQQGGTYTGSVTITVTA